MFPLKEYTFILAALLFCPLEVNSQGRLANVQNIKAEYNVIKDVVAIGWDKVSSAGKYFLEVKDTHNNVIFSVKNRKNSAFVPGELLTETSKYTISVNALKNGAFAASKVQNKNYTFTTRVPTDEILADFKTLNSGGRSGQYYLPPNYRLKHMPLMVIFHGSNIAGSNVLKLFKKLAKEYNFIIVAPDSSNPMGWNVPYTFTEPTEDQLHTYNLLEELDSLPHININREKVLVAGISAGGAMSAFLGSSDEQFKNIAVLHGGILIKELGANRVNVWLSTGDTDTLRTPEEVLGYVPQLQELGFPNVVYQEYPAGHQVLRPEQEELVRWWITQ